MDRDPLLLGLRHQLLIFLLGGPAKYQAVGEQGITEAEFDLRAWSQPYARVVVRDDAGRKAWTNPIWFDGA